MRFEEMTALLREGGVDTDTFDERSAKSLRELHQEILDKEVVLELHRGRACRIAMTVKILIVVAGIEVVQQLKRVYPNGKEVVRSGSASISETRIRGEHITETVKRGMREECGIEISDGQISLPTIYDHLFMSDSYGITDFFQRIDEHESTVYTGVRTISTVDYFEVWLPVRPWPEEIHVIDDMGVKIHLGYRRLENPPHIDKHLHALRK